MLMLIMIMITDDAHRDATPTQARAVRQWQRCVALRTFHCNCKAHLAQKACWLAAGVLNQTKLKMERTR